MAKKQKNSAQKKSTKNSFSKNEKGVDEIKLEVPGALKALCILSFIGFVYCLLLDSSDYLAYSNFDELAQSTEQGAFEKMEERIAKFDLYDVDVTDKGLHKLALMAIYRTIIDVLAMVGTALMFFKIKRGYYIYVFFQGLYVFLPFLMFGIGTFAIFEKGIIMVPIIYIGLFTTQLKHLTR